MKTAKRFDMSAKGWEIEVSAVGCAQTTRVSIDTYYKKSGILDSIGLDIVDVPKLIVCLEDILTEYIEENR